MVKKKVAAKAAKGYKLPDPIPLGQILTDMIKNQWKLGKSIGQGGFGEIYLASNVTSKSVADNSEYVVKIEPHSNGPLFAEMHCYMRIAKPDYIEAWKRTKKLKHLGMPKYFGSGSHEYKGEKYRFMIMQRFGQDLQKIIDKHEKMFSYKTVFQIMIQILDVLEYIHFHGYIHADIKASNLLVGHQKGTEGNVYLVDYGLACRYTTNGKHKEYKYDQRKAHDGTIEFTSRDAHIGAHSRRGDLEILGYNLVQWLCGKLPWEDNLQDCNYVANKKRILMDDIPKFMKICFPDGAPPGIQNFMEYVASLTFDETPNYEKCKAILRDGLKKRGHVDDGRLVFMSATPKANSRLPNGKKVSQSDSPDLFSGEDSMESDSTPKRSIKKRNTGKKQPGPKSKKAKVASSSELEDIDGESSEATKKTVKTKNKKTPTLKKAKKSPLANSKAGTSKRATMTPTSNESTASISSSSEFEDLDSESNKATNKRTKANKKTPTPKRAKKSPLSNGGSSKSLTTPRRARKAVLYDETTPVSSNEETPKRGTKKTTKLAKKSPKSTKVLPKKAVKSTKPKTVVNGSNYSSLSNPTPAMLAVMNKKLNR